MIGKVLVIGGGTAGMSAAISLRQKGMAVDLVEIDPKWRPDGAGISVNGPMLRAIASLGLLEDMRREGAVGDGLVLHTPAGDVIAKVDTPRIAGADVPATGGIMRAALAGILARKTRECGTEVLLGLSCRSISDLGNRVEVSFSNGMSQSYDLVIVADGLYSKTRDQLFPDAPKPRYTGQAAWRAVLPRPHGIEAINVWLGVPGVKPGINPISASHIYMFITENAAEKQYVLPEDFVSRMKVLLEPFPCETIQTFRNQLSEDSMIAYRPLEGMLMRDPWYRGRILMIGDTVHGTTPHLTAGAMMAIEDGIVVAEEIAAGGAIDKILQRFFERRFERCRLVVENAGRLGELEMQGGSEAEYNALYGASVRALAEPI